jgi:uncharacterized protein YdhG (YjbR/CyaY superfamily)
MANPDRASYFPAIEKKYGQPMSYWFGVMKELSDQKYPEQMAYLQENHGFSRAHANALVLYSRGSTSSRKFTSVDEFLAKADSMQAKTISTILAAITLKYPRAEVVMAWNQPMVKIDGKYVFGVSTTKGYLLLAPFGSGLLEEFLPRLDGYVVNKKTVRVPSDWKVNKKLVQDMAAASLRAHKA